MGMCVVYVEIQLQNYYELEVIDMARRDGTGPNGRGPKTGRGRGNC